MGNLDSKMAFGRIKNGFIDCGIKNGKASLTIQSSEIDEDKKNYRNGEYWLGEKNGDSFNPTTKITDDFLEKIEGIICDLLRDEVALIIKKSGRVNRFKNAEEFTKHVNEAIESGKIKILKNITPGEVGVILAARVGALLNKISD